MLDCIMVMIMLPMFLETLERERQRETERARNGSVNVLVRPSLWNQNFTIISVLKTYQNTKKN